MKAWLALITLALQSVAVTALPIQNDPELVARSPDNPLQNLANGAKGKGLGGNQDTAV